MSFHLMSWNKSLSKDVWCILEGHIALVLSCFLLINQAWSILLTVNIIMNLVNEDLDKLFTDETYLLYDILYFEGWERKRSKVSFTYIHLGLFLSPLDLLWSRFFWQPITAVKSPPKWLIRIFFFLNDMQVKFEYGSPSHQVMLFQL